MGEKPNNKERIIYFDLLRIVACFSVVMLHVSSQYWYYLPVTDFRWLVCNTFDALFRFGVPIFVMISGALFLQREEGISFQKLYFKNILKIVVVYIVWSIFYAVWSASGTMQITIRDFLKIVLESKYHLWFLRMLLSIYIMIPIFMIVAQKGGKKLIEYLLALFFVFQIVRCTFMALPLHYQILKILSLFNMDSTIGYIGYFFLGYYLYQYPVKKEVRKWIYLFGMVGAVLASGLSAYFSIKHGVAESGLFDSFSIFTFFICVALFVYFRSLDEKIKLNSKVQKVVLNLSADTFGIYLIHIFLIEMLFRLGIHSMMFPNILCIPFLTCLCFGIGALVIAFIRRIPFVGKWIC